jgi:hypothetical protein
MEMSEQNVINTQSKNTDTKGALTAGIILVTIGLGLLIFNTFDIGMYFPLALGLVFLIAGIVTRNAGLLIPGGIIGGVGLGTISTVNGWFFPTNSVESGGVFLLFFALGWFLITLLSKLFTSDTQTWSMIPGSVMVVIGGLVLMGERGTNILMMMGKYWPVVLVVIGASILIGWWRDRK